MKTDLSSRMVAIIQIVFVLGVIFGAFRLSALLQTDPPSLDGRTLTSEAVISVTVTKPTPQRYVPTVELNGVIQSQAQTNIAAQVGGRVKRVSDNFKPGAKVAAGAFLFQIDPADYKLSVDQAEANIASAESDLQLLIAEAALAEQEWQDLFPDREITDLAAKRPQIAATEARLAGAKAAKRTAELSLARTRVVAPADARILSTTLSIGQILSPNQVVGQLYAIDSVEISIPLSSDELSILQPIVGRAVTLSSATDRMEEQVGLVGRVDSVLDPRTRLASIYVIPTDPEALTIGAFVDLSITADPKDEVLLLPKSALSARNEIWVVSDGTLQTRRVRVLGEDPGGIYAEGFDVADGVLVLPPVDAVEGMPVRIRDADAALSFGGALSATAE